MNKAELKAAADKALGIYMKTNYNLKQEAYDRKIKGAGKFGNGYRKFGVSTTVQVARRGFVYIDEQKIAVDGINLFVREIPIEASEQLAIAAAKKAKL